VTADNVLLDTGPIVALLHRDDRHHRACVAALEGMRGVLLTTEPVLTEAMYLLSRVQNGPARCLEFFERGAAVLVPMTRPGLEHCRALMARYADVPMDFADATLVALAEEAGLDTVFTLDRRGFSAYRAGRRALRMLPRP
jgi:predicted nucleic acid-binding protein